MVNIYTLPLGAYQTNTYIVHAGDSRNCVVIDPGYQADTILQKVASLGLTIDAVALTHGHFDHVGAVEQIVEETGCALWLHEKDWALPIDPMSTHFYPLSNWDLGELTFCRENMVLSGGGLSFSVLETPGHTPGSVCYRCGEVLFSGDTLFAGSCGRTDLPGGDQAALSASLARLAALEGSLRVYPGHGGATTLDRERTCNPYLMGAKN